MMSNMATPTIPRNTPTTPIWAIDDYTYLMERTVGSISGTCTPSRDGRYTDDLVDAIEHAWTGIMDSPPKIIEKKENEIITDEPATENLPHVPATCQYPVPQMH
jgi:hypothetical protein